MQQNDMGGGGWRDQFAFWFPILGEFGEPGVLPSSPAPTEILSRQELFRLASPRFVSATRGQDPEVDELWLEAMPQVKKMWPHGPRRYTAKGEFRAGGELIVANPAFRHGAQQVDRLGAVGDLRGSSSNEATLVRTPISLPPGDHIAQKCMLFDRKGESRPLALAEADRADTYKQLPIKGEHELAAAVALRNPTDGLGYEFAPRAQLFGFTLAVLRYNCFSRAIAALAGRILKILCVGYRGDSGIQGGP